ncbi:MAG: hypothetical protein R3F55_04885 [Alphaproteobacteria bacterium]
MPAMFRPLQELENTRARHLVRQRAGDISGASRQGLGQPAARPGRGDRGGAQACRHLNIIVADRNDGAQRLYGRRGYVEAARRPMVKQGWQSASDAFVLLKRPA